MLIKQRQVIDNNRTQGQQLRPLYTLDRHLDTPLKDPLEQPVEGLNRLRSQLMGRVSDLYFHWEVCHGDSTLERRCPWDSFP
jgi:hypothetical protein